MAIWNGELGARAERINDSEHVYAFARSKYEHDLVVVLNLSDQEQSTQLFRDVDNLKEIFTDEVATISAGSTITLGPWEYLVFSNQ